jgi:hypothetical protein
MKPKYTTKFTNEIVASTSLYGQDWEISSANLSKLKSLVPKDIDFKKNIDLIGVAFNAAVVNRFNKNDDAIDTKTALAIKDYFVNKPTNIEHQKQKVVGHIVSASFSEFDKNKLIDDDTARQLAGPFNIALGAVVYRTVHPQFADALENAEEEGWDKIISASWELGFNKYSIAVGDSDDLNELELITKPAQIEEFKHYLKAYGGEGTTNDGVAVKRLVSGEIYPLGIAFTANPAADVEGLYINKETKEMPVAQEDDAADAEEVVCFNDVCFVRSLINLEEKISHSSESNVIQHNRQAMDNQDIIQKLEELLSEHASSSSDDKKVMNTEEAVASISQFVHEAIRQKSDEYVAEKEQAAVEKKELLEKEEKLQASLEGLQQKLTDAEAHLSDLEGEKLERQSKARFNERMAIIDSAYELDEEDLVVIASQVNTLGADEEDFESYKKEFSVVWKHKSTEAVAALKEEMEQAIQAEVQRKLQESQASVAPQVAPSTEEVVDAALENADEATATIPNNNEELSQEGESLRERFKHAFAETNLTIKY